MYYYIYETKNLINGMLYRGCHSTEDLEDGYLGSGVYLKRALRKYGKENFKIEILEFCEDRDHMAEREAHYVDDEWISREDTYNLQTGGLSNGVLCENSKEKISLSVRNAHLRGDFVGKTRIGVPMTQTQKERISAAMKKRYESIEHPSKGREPWNKGKKGLHETSEETKQKLSEMASQYWSDQSNREMVSETLKERYRNQEHHLKGKEPWNKGKKCGPSWNAGKKDVVIVCPHCGKEGGRSSMKRWHFDNCKMKGSVT